MKYWTSALALVALAVVPFAFAADQEVKSGLAVGKTIGAFDVTKCAGTEDDGVKIGATLCYRCKYGARPMVMIFSRNADKSLAQLMGKLDEVVAKNTDKEFKAFINIVGEDKEKLEEAAKKFGDPFTFVGHEGGDDFVVVCTYATWEPLCKGITSAFDSDVKQFYGEADARQGFIESLDRQGRRMRFPLMSISLAVASNHYRPIDDHRMVVSIAAEMKKFVKKMEGSSYAIDKRTN